MDLKGNQKNKKPLGNPALRPGISGNPNGNPAWKKGVSGNPRGRPPLQKMIPDHLREIGNLLAPPGVRDELQKEVPHIDFTNANNFQAVMWRVYIDAEKGDNNARDFIADRTEGKIKQPLDLGFDAFKIQAALNLSAENSPEPPVESINAPLEEATATPEGSVGGNDNLLK